MIFLISGNLLQAGGLNGNSILGGIKHHDKTNSVAIGNQAEATENEAYAIGTNAKSRSKAAFAFGHHADLGTGSDFGYVIGGNSKLGNNSKYWYVIGHYAEIGEGLEDVYAIGARAKVFAKNSFVVGSNSIIDRGAENTIVLGNNVGDSLHNNGVKLTNSVYLGNGSWEATENETTIGTGNYSSTNINGLNFDGYAGSNTHGIVTIGKKTLERRIQNVASGWVDAKSTDAINGSQLYSVTKKLTEEIKKINTGAVPDLKYEGDNGGNQNLKLKDQTLKLKGGKNITTKSESNGKITFDLKDEITLGNVIIGNDKISVDGKTYITSNGLNANSKKIIKVSEGDVSSTSTDAINGKQLHEVKQAVTKNEQNITNINKELKSVVKYDNDSHDTITLKNSRTKIKNVKDATSDDEAVNLGQLNSAKTELINKGLKFGANKGTETCNIVK